MFGKGTRNLLGVNASQEEIGAPATHSSSCPYHDSLKSVAYPARFGTFDIDLEQYYQSDLDFEKSVNLWRRFPQKEVTMNPHDLKSATQLLPGVPISELAAIKTKCNRPCRCGRENNALDLIQFCVMESIHGTEFLTKVLSENRKNKKISIMDSTHRSPLLADSVQYIDDTKPIPCLACGEEVHMYLLSNGLAHYWLC